MGDLAFIFFVLVAIVRGLFVFFRWAIRGLTRLNAPGRVEAPQAMPPQGIVPPQRVPLQSQRPVAPQYQPVSLNPGTPSSFSPARRADAGGPAVPQEATTASFRAEEEQLFRSEPQYIAPQNDLPAASPAETPLFNNTNDFIRAFILQEALGPPLSRRQRH